jgi:hypothetical protein
VKFLPLRLRPRPGWLLLGLCLVPLVHAAEPVPLPATPRFAEETDAAGLQSRFEGEGE